jgi:thiamine kinase-like enzyme
VFRGEASQGGNVMAIVDLVESGLGLIRTESDITSNWVQGVLHGSGALEPTVSVTDVRTERIGEGVGILSILQRVIPTYSGATQAPASFVVKYPTDDATQRFTADALVLYIRELTFYKECAADAPFKTARCYGQAILGDNTDFTIAMEDISHLRGLNQLEGVSLEDSKIILDVLADFHAQWWDNPKLDAFQSCFQPLDNPTYNAVLPMLWQGGWPMVEQHGMDIVPQSVAHIGEMWAGKVPWMLSSLMSPRTLCHGDYRADNLMFEGKTPVAIDFQIVGTGSGIYDVGYFISQSIAASVRQGHDRELVNGYLDRLESHGITVDRDEMWRQYLITICFCVTYGVTTFQGITEQNERGQNLIREMLGRSLQCVADNDALSVFN